MKFRLGKSVTSLFKRGYWWVDTSAAEGIIVTRKHGYLQKCCEGETPFGVYTNGSYRKMYQMDGGKIEVTIPQGVIVKGNAMVKALDPQ